MDLSMKKSPTKDQGQPAQASVESSSNLTDPALALDLSVAVKAAAPSVARPEHDGRPANSNYIAQQLAAGFRGLGSPPRSSPTSPPPRVSPTLGIGQPLRLSPSQHMSPPPRHSPNSGTAQLLRLAPTMTLGEYGHPKLVSGKSSADSRGPTVGPINVSPRSNPISGRSPQSMADPASSLSPPLRGGSGSSLSPSHWRNTQVRGNLSPGAGAAMRLNPGASYSPSLKSPTSGLVTQPPKVSPPLAVSLAPSISPTFARNTQPRASPNSKTSSSQRLSPSSHMSPPIQASPTSSMSPPASFANQFEMFLAHQQQLHQQPQQQQHGTFGKKCANLENILGRQRQQKQAAVEPKYPPDDDPSVEHDDGKQSQDGTDQSENSKLGDTHISMKPCCDSMESAREESTNDSKSDSRSQNDSNLMEESKTVSRSQNSNNTSEEAAFSSVRCPDMHVHETIRDIDENAMAEAPQMSGSTARLSEETTRMEIEDNDEDKNTGDVEMVSSEFTSKEVDEADIEQKSSDVPSEEDAQTAEDGSKAAGDDQVETKEEESEKSDAKKAKTGAAAGEVTGPHIFKAEQVIEYQWPAEKNADFFVLQEQISEFLGVLSFKRKYPDLQRKPVEYKERIFLREKGAVTETQCDLGLTALRTEEVYDLMATDYPEKYKEMCVVIQARERQKIRDQQKEYNQINLEKSKFDLYRKKAIRATADFNAHFMREKREERRAYFDLQTMEVQYPQGKFKVLPPEATKPHAYPVSLIPGQFQDHYKKYTTQELQYLPLNTAMFSPPKILKSIYVDPGAPADAEDDPEEKVDVQDDGSQDSESDSSVSDAESDAEVNGDSVDGVKEETETETEQPAGPAVEQQQQQVGTPARGSTKDARKNSRKRGAAEPPAVEAKEATPAKKARKTPGKTPARKKQAPVVVCHVCQSGEDKNKQDVAEELVKCSDCSSHGHPTCLELTEEMIPIIKTYSWQCMDCKTCVKCRSATNEEKMMFCDHCDRGYHTFCVGLKSIPPGRWECPSCRPEETPKKGRKRKQRQDEGESAETS